MSSSWVSDVPDWPPIVSHDVREVTDTFVDIVTLEVVFG